MPEPAVPVQRERCLWGGVRYSTSLSTLLGSLISPQREARAGAQRGRQPPAWFLLNTIGLTRGFLGLVQGEKCLQRPLATTGFTTLHFRRVSCYQETWNPEQTPHTRPRSMPGREDTFPRRWARPAHSHSPGVCGNRAGRAAMDRKGGQENYAAWSCKNAIEREKEMVRFEFGVAGRKPDTGSIENSPLIFKFLLIQ